MRRVIVGGGERLERAAETVGERDEIASRGCGPCDLAHSSSPDTNSAPRAKRMQLDPYEVDDLVGDQR